MSNSLDHFFDEACGQLKRASADKKHPMRFCVLSTIDIDGSEQRYVVLRKIDVHGQLIYFTDGRSAKVKQLRSTPKASLLFYHPGKRMQVRVEGIASLHNQDEISRQYWPMVQGDTWKAYGSVLSPGTGIEEPEDAFEWEKGLAEAHFTVMAIKPITLEVLTLNGLTHKRAKYTKENDKWCGNWLVP